MKALATTRHTYIGTFATALIGGGFLSQTDWNNNFASLALGTPILAFPPFLLATNTTYLDSLDASDGQDTLYSANRYYAIDLATSGNLMITLSITDSITNDLDLLVWEDPAHTRGEFYGKSDGTGAVETFTLVTAGGPASGSLTR